MYLQTVQPIRDKDLYSKRLAQLVIYDLYQMIYKPLLDLLSPALPKKNATGRSVLVSAFDDGRIYWQDGFVFGRFNASITKALLELGGRFHQSRKAFKLELAQLPPDIRSAISRSSIDRETAMANVVQKTKELTPENIVVPGMSAIAADTMSDLQKQFSKVTPADLGIPLEMKDAQRAKMTEDYTQNLDLAIKGWSNQAIFRLRDRVEQEVGAGVRAEDLKDILLAEFKTTESRIKFIARQETSLLVAKYREVRYEDAGIEEYRWSTSNDERVRESHKELNNRIFTWDNPPIVDKATGRRANPGEDYGCRCVALPVFRVGGRDVLNSRFNSKTLRIDLKPAEYFELVKEGFGYPTIAHLFATLLSDKVEEIKKEFATVSDLGNAVLEYKWTGKRILFWQDGRHRMKAALDLGVESVGVDVLLPEDYFDEACRIMPTWFIEKLKAKDTSLVEV